jgi:AraC-like DNA-binding protein
MINDIIHSASHAADRAEAMAYKSIVLQIQHLRFEHGLSIRKIAKRAGYKEWEVKDIITRMEDCQ